jgi:Mrp family chromosome partitioning ATPase
VLLGSTRLVSLAELPTVPFFPKKLPFLAAGSTLALLLAFAAVLLSEHLVPIRLSRAAPQLDLDQKRRPAPGEAAAASPALAPLSADPTIGDILAPFQGRPAASPPHVDEPRSELAAVVGARVLANLPVLRLGSSESPIHAILSGRPVSAIGRALEASKHDHAYLDALAQLATELKLVPRGHRQIIVTSAAAGQGSTLLTLALACFAASEGCRVLAVECNLIRPVFHDVFPGGPGAGLLAVLRGEAAPQDAVTATGIPNLEVIAPGASASRQTSWLLRPEMSSLLEWARSYDVVLIDGPPSAFIADARVLVVKVDGALLCARPGRSSIGQIVAASSAIKSLGGNVLGLAMNAADDAEAELGSGVDPASRLDRAV